MDREDLIEAAVEALMVGVAAAGRMEPLRARASDAVDDMREGDIGVSDHEDIVDAVVDGFVAIMEEERQDARRRGKQWAASAIPSEVAALVAYLDAKVLELQEGAQRRDLEEVGFAPSHIDDIIAGDERPMEDF